jgi:hypothetical protein
MDAARAARQKGDSAAVKAAWDRGAADRDKMKALRDREQAEIRAALSPENQKLFDANKQELEKRRAEWTKGGKKGDGKGEGRGHGKHRGGENG